MPRVSVILATSNRRDDLLECVTSILNQSYRDIELIVMDDGSTDGSPSAFLDRWSDSMVDSIEGVGESFIQDDNRLTFVIDGIPVFYVQQGNRGCSRAFNCGLKRARGDYVAFADPEVRWHPRRIEKQIRVFREKPKVVICVAGLIPSRNGRQLKAVQPGEGGWLFRDVVNDRYMPYTTALIDRRAFGRVGGFDENLPSCEDYDLWVRLTANFPVHTVNEGLVRGPRKVGGNSWSANRYRVYALEKAFQSGYLVSEYRCIVAEQIVAKCEKLVNGFEKKNNTERASFYERKRRKFASEVRKLKASSRDPVTAAP